MGIKNSIQSPFPSVYVFLVGIVASIIGKISLFKHPFFGLEYEDSYIFTSVARSLDFDYTYATFPYLTKVCGIGSLANCELFSIYSGHFMMFPFVLSLVNKIFGYHILNTFLVNFVCSVYVLFISIKIGDIIWNRKWVNTLILSVLLATTPFLSLYNTSGLSETFSSAFIVTFVLFYLKFRNSRYSNWMFFSVAILILLLSLFVKRDNSILFLLPIMDIFFKMFIKKNKSDFGHLALFTISAIILGLIVYFVVLKIPRMVQFEAEDIGLNPFSFSYFTKLFPVFVGSLIKLDSFGITGVFFLISMFVSFKLNNEVSLIALMCCLFILMYSMHYRGYYFVTSGQTSIVDTYRYYSNFYPLVCICSIDTLMRIYDRVLKTNKPLWVFGFLIVLFNLNRGYVLRTNLSYEEHHERISPVLSTLDIINASDIIVTDIPVVFQMYCSENLLVVDANKMNQQIESAISKAKRDVNVYVLERARNSEFFRRYPNYSKFLHSNNFQEISKVSSNYTLRRLL